MTMVTPSLPLEAPSHLRKKGARCPMASSWNSHFGTMTRKRVDKDERGELAIAIGMVYDNPFIRQMPSDFISVSDCGRTLSPLGAQYTVDEYSEPWFHCALISSQIVQNLPQTVDERSEAWVHWVHNLHSIPHHTLLKITTVSIIYSERSLSWFSESRKSRIVSSTNLTALGNGWRCRWARQC